MCTLLFLGKDEFNMKKLIGMTMGMMMCLGVCACGKEEVIKVPVGEYISGNGSRVTILEENKMVIENVDFSDMEKYPYEDYTLVQKKKELGRELTEKEKEEICSAIDLEQQFSNKECSYTTQMEDGVVGIYLPVNGSELFLYLQYFPADHTLVMEDMIFSDPTATLEETNKNSVD